MNTEKTTLQKIVSAGVERSYRSAAGGKLEDDRNVLCYDCGGGYMTLCICQNLHFEHHKEQSLLYVNF